MAVSYSKGIKISIHALLAESDHGTCIVFLSLLVFLSTLSLRRATRKVFVALIPDKYFYPRSPCGERLMHALKLADPVLFLSTLSLRRATIDKIPYQRQIDQFLSTLSLRRATAIDVFLAVWAVISIHALLAESDTRETTSIKPIFNFYPRSPCGERLHRTVNIQRPTAFLSTLSLRRATSARPETRQHDAISIHALLAESDWLSSY